MRTRTRTRAGLRAVGLLMICTATTALLLAGSAGAATRGPSTPWRITPGGRGPVAGSILQVGVAAKTVQLLGEGAVFAVGGKGFGWALQAFGLEDDTAGEIVAIRGQLKEIQGSLAETLAATTQIRSELAQSTYSGLVAQTTPITANVDKGMEDLQTVAEMSPGDPTKRNYTGKVLDFIGTHLMGGAQTELNKRVVGEAGSDGLVVAASKVARTASPYWTARTSEQVHRVFDYYQEQEVRLLVLRVEYMHTEPTTYSKATIEGAIQRVREELQNQDHLLKPSPPVDVIADTRSKNIYDLKLISGRHGFVEAAARIAEGTCGDACWEVAGGPAIAPLIQGWSGGSWTAWLDQQTHNSIPALVNLDASFEGVWTEAKCPAAADVPKSNRAELPYYCKGSFLKPDGVDEVINIHSGKSGPTSLKNGYILVKGRTEDYWW